MPVSQKEIDDACAGMAQAIFEQIKIHLTEQLTAAFQPIPAAIRPDLDDTVRQAEPSWHALATAIATGVVTYLTTNMKIIDIKTTVPIHPTVQGDTGATTIDGHEHLHTVGLVGVQTETLFTQSDDGTGHITWKLPESPP
jgi:hypothetical protein